jgi:hypothetical protein
MSILSFICLIGVFYLSAFISAVTGGTWLLTVPMMIQAGIEPRLASCNASSWLRSSCWPQKRCFMMCGGEVAGDQGQR